MFKKLIFSFLFVFSFVWLVNPADAFAAFNPNKPHGEYYFPFDNFAYYDIVIVDNDTIYSVITDDAINSYQLEFNYRINSFQTSYSSITFNILNNFHDLFLRVPKSHPLFLDRTFYKFVRPYFFNSEHNLNAVVSFSDESFNYYSLPILSVIDSDNYSVSLDFYSYESFSNSEWSSNYNYLLAVPSRAPLISFEPSYNWRNPIPVGARYASFSENLEWVGFNPPTTSPFNNYVDKDGVFWQIVGLTKFNELSWTYDNSILDVPLFISSPIFDLKVGSGLDTLFNYDYQSIDFMYAIEESGFIAPFNSWESQRIVVSNDSYSDVSVWLNSIVNVNIYYLLSFPVAKNPISTPTPYVTPTPIVPQFSSYYVSFNVNGISAFSDIISVPYGASSFIIHSDDFLFNVLDFPCESFGNISGSSGSLNFVSVHDVLFFPNGSGNRIYIPSHRSLDDNQFVFDSSNLSSSIDKSVSKFSPIVLKIINDTSPLLYLLWIVPIVVMISMFLWKR